MPLDYLNLNDMFASVIRKGQHLERYIGVKQEVDVIHNENVDINQIASPKHWQTVHLLTQQLDAAQNGVYLIRETGQWQALRGDLEVGNLVTSKHPDEFGQYTYYELVAKQGAIHTWQPFILTDLSSS